MQQEEQRGGSSSLPSVIGVLAKEAEYPAVMEFFELFKTPWEFYRNGAQYDVLICTGDRYPENSAKLVLVFGAATKAFDRQKGCGVGDELTNPVLVHSTGRIPIRGRCSTVVGLGTVVVTEETSRQPAALEQAINGQRYVRFGFDIFQEIRYLLTHGQPVWYAAVPVIENHIALLRNLIVQSAIVLVEIPPFPLGYSFIACLTHDVDHPRIRNHRCDSTMFGFLYRATVGSLLDFVRERKSAADLATNWAAAVALPLVHLGLVKDFWRQFDHYLSIEKGLGSTFFIVPERANPGVGHEGRQTTRRGVRYCVEELAEDLRRLVTAGCEVGVHGIDAWRDSTAGRLELKRISGPAGNEKLGVRMHWLFSNDQTHARLEEAGFAYDSTVGYNEAIGYRAGTSQVFKPLSARSMLELPMNIMDTALFYPQKMNLSPELAWRAVMLIVANAVRYGGVLTVNWHDRSLAPERLWGRFYLRLLDELKCRDPWFCTASQAVAWFRTRRSVVFDDATRQGLTVRLSCLLYSDRANLPGLRVRVYNSLNGHSRSGSLNQGEVGFTDHALEPGNNVQINSDS